MKQEAMEDIKKQHLNLMAATSAFKKPTDGLTSSSPSDVFHHLKDEMNSEKLSLAEATPLSLNTAPDNLSGGDVSKGTSNMKDSDIISSLENEKQVDNQLLKDFKSRYTEEHGFQSIQKADEMLNELQELALRNQKQIDAHQSNGDFYQKAIENARSSSRLQIAAAKRNLVFPQKLTHNNNNNKIKKYFKNVMNRQKTRLKSQSIKK